MTPTAHISVAKDIGSKLTTSGATNSGVPNKTCSFLWGSWMRARPKSIILMRLPVFVGHKMFSGCKERKKGKTNSKLCNMYVLILRIFSNYRLNHVEKSNRSILYLICYPIQQKSGKTIILSLQYWYYENHLEIRSMK